MIRRNRIALIGGVLLLVALSGTVLATRESRPDQAAGPNAQGPDESPPTPEDLAHAADRLRAADIEVDGALLGDLAARYGLGGAVRVIAWADDPDDDITVESITAMRDGNGTPESIMGWGQIARELGLHPGLGSIIGQGGGQGRHTAPGQQGEGP